MTARRITQMPFPPAKFRIDLLSGAFERKQQAVAEDARRAAGLRRLAKASSDKVARKASRLAKLLVGRGKGRPPKSCASSHYMGDQRIRIVGSLLPIAQADHDTLRFFTIIQPDWSFPASDLAAVRPQLVMSAFRSLLVRRRSAQASGWLFAMYHGEFDPVTDRYQGHIHGFAAGGMATIVKGLGTSRKLRSSRTSGGDGSVVDPVHVSRKPITNLPHVLSYALKSYWPEYRVGPGGSRKVRIREPRHSEWLLWLHKRKLGELILMMKLSVGSDGLKRKLR